MKLLYAIRFLTIIPIPYKADEDMKKVAGSTIFYPLVGLIIGGLLFLILKIVGLVFNPATTAVFLISFWALLTGGLHLDGLSDLVDGLGGGRNREQTLEIMKDSRIGAFGVISLILHLFLKWRLSLDLIQANAWLIFLIIPMFARWNVLLSILIFPSARKDGLGSFFKKYCGWYQPLAGGIFSFAAAYLLLGLNAVLAGAISSLLALLFSGVISKKLGGLTGDVYGAVIELSELFLMIAYLCIMVIL
ncbi:MAG: adenosylcobinamide-GDP ribazoletransferase [Spirochaetales bacterium]|nr:adenosylcobinamide-GDP ribazoletransferase [Spirochaetales bacterium]